MTVDIIEIRRKHKMNSNGSELESSVYFYIKSAEKIISYFAPKIRPGLERLMLSSEDVISNVATKLMLADIEWNQNYESKYRKVRSKRSLRLMYGKWAILEFVKRHNENKKKNIYSLNNLTFEDKELGEFLSDSHFKSQIDQLINKQTNEDTYQYIEDMLTSGIISKQEEKYIRMKYLDGKTQSEISREEGISRERVRQVIQSAIKKLNENY